MRRSIFRHWLPRLTICPVNGLPDLIYCTVAIDNSHHDLYVVRKKVASIVPFRRKAYMEDIAQDLVEAFPEATYVEVRLAFNRHIVRMYNVPVTP